MLVAVLPNWCQSNALSVLKIIPDTDFLLFLSIYIDIINTDPSIYLLLSL